MGPNFRKILFQNGAQKGGSEHFGVVFRRSLGPKNYLSHMPSLLVLNAVSKNIVFTKEDDCFSAAEFFLTSTAEISWQELATLILTYCISCGTGTWCVAWLPSVDRRWLTGPFSTTNSVRWTPAWSSGSGSAAPSSPAGSLSTVSSGAGIYRRNN